jgi:NADH dehydrogenase
MVVLVTGSTGFLGRKVVQELLKRNHQVRCLVHTPGRERVFEPRSVDVQYGAVTDPDALASACRGVDAIIHLVAIILQRGQSTFNLINRQGTANLVAAASAAGTVKELIMISAIGATSNRRYPYLFSKWQAERAVIESGLPYTIIRPSLIFGEGDEFINALASLVRIFPVVPVIGTGRNRFQPIQVEDVARCIVSAMGRGDLKGKTVEIGGPEQLSYNEIIGLLASTLQKRRLRFHVPPLLVWPNVMLMQKLLPRPPLNTEELRMLSIRNVAELDTVEKEFGFKPRRVAGNIDFVKSIGAGDAWKTVLGFMPATLRDH